MTPDQLLGLQRHARAKTMSPEITIETGDAVPTVIAGGTGESVPITVEPMIFEPARGSQQALAGVQAIDEVIAELAVAPKWFATKNDVGAFVGFTLFGAWTLVEIAMLLAR